ncbi:hypothetical protein [Bacillus sp. JCM 19041]|uniref:hypothetical protein n=1 Tax=Bacillus sp. JCM 19041 TaxID=1460637 RepID=UPI0018D0AA97
MCWIKAFNHLFWNKLEDALLLQQRLLLFIILIGVYGSLKEGKKWMIDYLRQQ